MGKISPGMKYMAINQARQKRDERGRYMGGEDGPEMRGGYNDGIPDMRYRDRIRQEDRPDTRREMGGEGYFVWDNANREPDWHPPERYGQPEHQREGNITDMRQYGRRYSPGMTMVGGKEQHQQRQIGFHQSGDDQGEHLTKEQAEHWVQQMHGADGSHGGRWTWNEIRQYAANFGISGEQKMIEFYAIINAMASDYGKVAKKYGVDKADFYADLAKAWLDDKDAVPGKAMIYYDCIVRKEDE